MITLEGRFLSDDYKESTQVLENMNALKVGIMEMSGAIVSFLIEL